MHEKCVNLATTLLTPHNVIKPALIPSSGRLIYATVMTNDSVLMSVIISSMKLIASSSLLNEAYCILFFIFLIMKIIARYEYLFQIIITQRRKDTR